MDSPRCARGADQDILRQLLACGLRWDGEVSWQSRHQERYQAALETLNTLQCLYPCTCSRQTIASALAAQGTQTPRNQEQVYPATCRPTPLQINDLSASLGQQVAWRLALPHDCVVNFDDIRLGAQQQKLNTSVGDFVLRRSDGLFTYQLAVVVDDAEQGVSHVVRGEDLLSNTARQIHLQELLGYSRPQYLHLPLVLDEKGEKLSKQTWATSIQTADAKQALKELQRAAKHLGLSGLPDGQDTSIAEYLLAATQSWGNR